MFHYNPENTGFTNSSAPKTTPTVLWEVEGAHRKGSSPNGIAIVDGVVYVAGNFLHAYNSTTGEFLWITMEYVSSQPFVLNGIVYTGNQAFNASTGTRIWNITSGLGLGAPFVVAVADGYVYTKGQEGLVGLNASTGSVIWNSTYSCSSYSPAISNGYIYFSTGNDIIALNAHTGSKLWAHKISSNYAWSSPAVDVNKVYVRDEFGILCLDSITGQKIWDYPLAWSDIFESSPAVAYGCVYIGSGDGNVYSLNASTGEKLWNYTTLDTSPGHGVHPSPAIADGAVYVAADDGYLYAFNASVGDKLWSYKLGEPQRMYCSPAIANGRIYMSSQDSFIVVLETSQLIDDNRFFMIVTIAISLSLIIVVIAIVSYYHKRAKRKPIKKSIY